MGHSLGRGEMLCGVGKCYVEGEFCFSYLLIVFLTTDNWFIVTIKCGAFSGEGGNVTIKNGH